MPYKGMNLPAAGKFFRALTEQVKELLNTDIMKVPACIKKMSSLKLLTKAFGPTGKISGIAGLIAYVLKSQEKNPTLKEI